MTVPTPPPPAPSALAQDLADLRALVASRHHVLLVDSDDEARLLALVREAAGGIPVWTWTATRGLARDGFAGQAGTAPLRGALAFVAALPGPAVVVVLDAGGLADDEVAVRLVKDLALGAAPSITVLLSGVPETPSSLEGSVLRWRLRRPRREELEDLVRRVLDAARTAGVPVTIAEADVPDVAAAVAGLPLPQAERAILRAGAADGRLAPDDLPRIRATKAELLAEASPLELVDPDVDLSAVGGLERLKAWLAERRRGFEPAAAAFGLHPPRGVLLTGVPGCGKSLAAKAVARSWGLPLVLLDVGRIYGSFLGQSEARLRQALDAVEAMAPVVLWIDEIEKGFGADEGAQDGGASSRVLATFLRWLQERPDGIVVVATANDATALPPELLRRGRFDEVFFVDLPTRAERTVILWTLLARRGHDPAGLDVDAVAGTTEGFSGAELENLVVGALYAAYTSGAPLSSALLQAEAAATVPLSRTRAESVAAIRAWAQGRAVPAS